jgi:probable phosphoglycerate mutase
VGRRLVGRAPGIALNETGIREVHALARELADRTIDAVYSSPLERAVATAKPIALARGLPVFVRESLTDIDFGSWTGQSLDELVPLPDFQRFNTHRSCTRPPQGEHVVEVQARMVSLLEELARTYPTASIAVVGHADPLKAAIGFFLGVPMDFLSRMELGTASMSELSLAKDHVALLSLNRRPAFAR